MTTITILAAFILLSTLTGPIAALCAAVAVFYMVLGFNVWRKQVDKFVKE